MGWAEGSVRLVVHAENWATKSDGKTVYVASKPVTAIELLAQVVGCTLRDIPYSHTIHKDPLLIVMFWHVFCDLRVRVIMHFKSVQEETEHAV